MKPSYRRPLPAAPRGLALITGALALAVVFAGTARAEDTSSSTSAPQTIVIQHLRAHDQRGVNVFESPKEEGVPYTGFKLQFGAAFTQQFQDLTHENTADTTGKKGANTLIPIGNGFNNAVANLYMDAQLAKGIRVQMTSYLSSRHHDETWVKDGCLVIDSSPIKSETLDKLFDVMTLKVGHFEINYGDMHFRRTDNGNAMYNPLVGNLLMDAYTTEIGGEAYLRSGGFLGMLALTGGEVHGQVTAPEKRGMSVMAKAGYDSQVNQATRIRVTGSLYTTGQSASNTLYTGDRAGSRYYDVLENLASSETANAWSGNVRPGFSNKVTAWVINPFIKIQGLELFGNIEQAKGSSAAETTDRTMNQYAGEVVYRFADDQFYVAGRYNQAKGRMPGIATDVSVNRIQVGGGWFLSQNMEGKAEYVSQTYNDFPSSDIRNGGKFSGVMVEGVVSF